MLRDDIYVSQDAFVPISNSPVSGSQRPARSTRNQKPYLYSGSIAGALPASGNASKKPIAAASSSEGQSSKKSSKNSRKRTLGDVALNVFLIVAIAAVVASLVGGASSGMPHPILGWSAQTVLTSSMQDVYPKDSLVVTQWVDPATLKVGDDVTYVASEDTTITHRIVAIIPDLEGAPEIAFQTKGTQNAYPDEGYVLASGIVGKVVFCSPELGAFVGWLKTYWAIPVFLIILAFGLKVILARIYKEEKDLTEKGGRTTVKPGGAANEIQTAKSRQVCSISRDAGRRIGPSGSISAVGPDYSVRTNATSLGGRESKGGAGAAPIAASARWDP